MTTFTQDEIIEMAKQAGWSGIYSSWTSPTNCTRLTVPVTMQQIEAFANLVAAKATATEREDCAKVAEHKFWRYRQHDCSCHQSQRRTSMNMTDEEILSAAESCGMMLFGLGMDKAKFEFCILAFAKFVGEIERFKEREACAKVAGQSFGVIGSTIAAAIRARGEN